MNIEHLAIRVRAEFQEMPGLRLTVRQAERLWGLAPDVCAQVVDVLVSRAILKRHGDTFSLQGNGDGDIFLADPFFRNPT